MGKVGLFFVLLQLKIEMYGYWCSKGGILALSPMAYLNKVLDSAVLAPTKSSFLTNFKQGPQHHVFPKAEGFNNVPCYCNCWRADALAVRRRTAMCVARATTNMTGIAP